MHIGFISPTLESDIGSCTKETSRSNLAIVQIRYYSMFLAIKHFIYDNFFRFYMFWATWFKNQVVEVKILIISLTFDLPTTTAAPTTTQVNDDELIKS